ncbi:MAG: phosphoribosylanthranilate isomerase [Anaerolineae bacterium]|nr:phosphoribosylanthranilate isomerase [Anaerolineae bacterium]
MLIYVKICGLTNLDDAYCAAEAGADFLGFIFYPPSPRYVKPEQVGEIARIINIEFGLSRPRFVGVFVNAPTSEVWRTIAVAGLDLVQLHGDEAEGELQALSPRAFKALRPQTVDEALAGLETYRPIFSTDSAIPELLVDAYHPAQYGGMGELADLSIARALSSRCRLLLAGGLDPDNVAQAVRQVRPWGVDVSSGAEASKGKKDRGRVKAFVEAVRAVDG